jgi:hypothetical protein
MYDYYLDEATDRMYFCIGRVDWMPIPTLMGLIESTDWLHKNIAKKLGVDEKLDVVEHWLKANEPIVNELLHQNLNKQTYRHLDWGEIEKMSTNEITPQLARKISLEYLANLYLAVFGKVQPAHFSNVSRLASHPILHKIKNSPELLQYKKSEDQAINYIDECVSNFFNEQDFKLSEDGRMVFIKGYEPLYFIDELNF